MLEKYLDTQTYRITSRHRHIFVLPGHVLSALEDDKTAAPIISKKCAMSEPINNVKSTTNILY